MKYVSQNADNLPRFVPNGDYLVTVIEASETFSKAGDEMIKLKLEVEEHGVRLYDYLVATESSFWKIDTFRKAIGEAVRKNRLSITAASMVYARALPNESPSFSMIKTKTAVAPITGGVTAIANSHNNTT